MSRSLFREFNAADGVAATKVWLETLCGDRGIAEDNEVFLFGTQSEMTDAALEGRFDVAIMTTPEFLALSQTGVVRQWFTYRRGGALGQRLSLIVSKDRGVRSIHDLAGQQVILFASEHTDIARLWLGIQTLEAVGRDADQFFASVETASQKASLAVLPVYFGQKAACVVTDEAFALAVELNPQIGRQLESIARSQPLAPVVICASTRSDPGMLEQVYRAFETGHEDPRVRQAFVTYRLERLEPIEDGMLDSVGAIIRRHRELVAEHGRPRP